MGGSLRHVSLEDCGTWSFSLMSVTLATFPPQCADAHHSHQRSPDLRIQASKTTSHVQLFKGTSFRCFAIVTQT